MLGTLNNEAKLIALPCKLPMIIKSKRYYRENVKGKIKQRLGGYLLNDEKFPDNFMILKWHFKEFCYVVNVIYY